MLERVPSQVPSEAHPLCKAASAHTSREDGAGSASPGCKLFSGSKAKQQQQSPRFGEGTGRKDPAPSPAREHNPELSLCEKGSGTLSGGLRLPPAESLASWWEVTALRGCPLPAGSGEFTPSDATALASASGVMCADAHAVSCLGGPHRARAHPRDTRWGLCPRSSPVFPAPHPQPRIPPPVRCLGRGRRGGMRSRRG